MFNIGSRVYSYNSFKDILITVYKTIFQRFEKNIKFKKSLKVFLDKENIELVSQARVGCYLIASYLKENGFKKIYICPFTNIDVINALKYSGCEVVFVDIDVETGLPKKSDLSYILNEASYEKIGLIVTHLYSTLDNLEKFQESVRGRNNNLLIIEDTAICFGAKINQNSFLGTLFDFGFYSFGQVKNLSTFFGGCVYYKDQNFKNYYDIAYAKKIQFPKIKIISKIFFSLVMKCLFENYIYNFFSVYLFKISYYGKNNFLYKFFYRQKFPNIKKNFNEYSYKFPDYLDSIGSKQLEKINSDIDTRFNKALKYYNNFKNNKVVFVPDIVDIRNKFTNAYLEYPLIIKNNKKYELLKFLRDRKIYLRDYWYVNNYKHFTFKKLDSLNNCNYLEKNLICLPCNPRINSKVQEKIIKNINYFFEKK